MARYFLEVAYKGTAYSGFQIQENANTIQAEVEKALQVLHRQTVQLTGSSRTDAGVHAFQNFFHFDFQPSVHPQAVYKLNAILPGDIAVKNLYLMPDDAHSRFDAISREYVYKIHRFKDPFLKGLSFYYPYKINLNVMQEAAAFLNEQTDFSGFSKTNTQVNNFNCTIIKSRWLADEEKLQFEIEANRFLRGMVRMLTATFLKLGREKISFSEFKRFFQQDGKAPLSVPAEGLYLKHVNYPKNFLRSSMLPFTEF